MSEPKKEDAPRKKTTAKYSAERVIGNGSFGIVYQAVDNESQKTVAIKKVLQDRRYKNRELQIMKMVHHPNVVEVTDCFYSRGNRNKDVYLNLVMEYIPETLYQTIRSHARAHQTIPYIYTKVYALQICRALSYCHSQGICHRDIKPQNLLLDPQSHTVKLCDFGSAKILVQGEPNVAYICSRYYRAPELIFESSDYTTSIDTWSMGCVIAELFLGMPLFQGGSGVDQLVEIIKVLGAPSKEEILAMNPNYTQYRFPEVKPLEWRTVFAAVQYKDQPVPDNGIDIVSNFLLFNPTKRIKPFEALTHPFFDEIRDTDLKLPNGRGLTNVWNFTESELNQVKNMKKERKILPPQLLERLNR